MKQKKARQGQERLNQIAWDIGNRYPVPLSSDYVVMSMVYPRLGHVHWHIGHSSIESRKAEVAELAWSAPVVVRVYDVTDIYFDGHNAHSFIDLEVGGAMGNYYFHVSQIARDYLAEAGLRGRDGSFHPVVRSSGMFFDRDRPSGNYHVAGFFVGGALNRIFPVENFFDAPVYERLNRELAGREKEEPLSAAVVFLGINEAGGFASPLGAFIRDVSLRVSKFGGDVRLFLPPREEAIQKKGRQLIRTVDLLAGKVYRELRDAHRQKPFHLVHCHDWYSAGVGLAAAGELNLPMIFSLHSTEHERTHGKEMDSLSNEICGREKTAVLRASLAIVPHSSTRQQVVDLYGLSPERVVIIPDALTEGTSVSPFGMEVNKWFNLPRDVPVVLFGGEMSHAAGADLLVDAVPTVCRNHRTVHFVFAGDGPLRNELEARVWHAGVGGRCRFPGDVPRETFEALLSASDFVVIPARTWQDEGLAMMAIEHGRPVLTTHQAGIRCVVHGQNGLVTFDNPGSIVWGVQELLFSPLRERMLRFGAKKSAQKNLSVENIAAQQYTYYIMALKDLVGNMHG